MNLENQGWRPHNRNCDECGRKCVPVVQVADGLGHKLDRSAYVRRMSGGCA